MTTDTKEKAHKINILQNVTVEADLSNMIWINKRLQYSDPERYAEALEKAVKEFRDFLRDHRSQDMITLDVNREYEEVCSVCREKWEEDKTENGKYCANCGAEIEEQE